MNEGEDENVFNRGAHVYAGDENDDDERLVGTSIRNDRNSFMYKTDNGLVISIYQSDITKAGTEAVVSATNATLNQSVGVGKAIGNVIGSSYSSDLDAYLRRNTALKTMQVMHVTNQGENQPFKYVILANGPGYGSYSDKEKCCEDLKSTFVNVFVHAHDTLKVPSIALPLVSSGANGIPNDKAADSLYRAVIMFDNNKSAGGSLTDIHIVDIDENTHREIANVFRGKLDMHPFE